MRHNRRVILAGLIGLGACSGLPETARLPDFSSFITGDAVRHSIEQGADMLTNPGRLTGQPWETARLIQALEFLSVELPNGPRWNVMLPMAQITVPRARGEWREAFGIAPGARAQEVIDSLTVVRTAFARRSLSGAVDALRPPLFTPGGQDTINRLGNPPALPRSRRALLDARQELFESRNHDRS
ncbi:MAG: hypothetical protein ING02_07870 [Roseomonas sp.]|nr:hypothetical protein [Roseomonas sp.]